MSKSNSSSGLGVFSVLGIIFVVLKLVGVIDWSWWWVTLPFWGGLALILSVVIIYMLVLGVIQLAHKLMK